MIQPSSKVHEFAAQFLLSENRVEPVSRVERQCRHDLSLDAREGKLRSRTLVRNRYQRGIRLIQRTDVEALCSPAQNQERPTSSNQAAKEKDRS